MNEFGNKDSKKKEECPKKCRQLFLQKEWRV